MSELTVIMKYSKSTPKGNHAIYSNADENDKRITSLYILKSALDNSTPDDIIEVSVKGVKQG